MRDTHTNKTLRLRLERQTAAPKLNSYLVNADDDDVEVDV